MPSSFALAQNVPCLEEALTEVEASLSFADVAVLAPVPLGTGTTETTILLPSLFPQTSALQYDFRFLWFSFPKPLFNHLVFQCFSWFFKQSLVP